MENSSHSFTEGYTEKFTTEKTFEQAKDEVAEKHGYDSYLDYLLTGSIADVSTYLHEAVELYSNSKAAKAWEDACELQRQMCSDQFLNAVDSKVRQTAAKEYCETAPKPTNPYK